jgi:hypothetical protein
MELALMMPTCADGHPWGLVGPRSIRLSGEQKSADECIHIVSCLQSNHIATCVQPVEVYSSDSPLSWARVNEAVL